MITLHKAQYNDIEKIIIAIITMRDQKDDKAILTKEVEEWLDHTYYLYDDEYNVITAVIAAVRILVEDNIPSIIRLEPTKINMQRYEIKYFVNSGGDVEALIDLIREFSADSNDAPQVFISKELDNNDPREVALKSSRFTYNKNLGCYIRIPAPEIDVNMRYL